MCATSRGRLVLLDFIVAEKHCTSLPCNILRSLVLFLLVQVLTSVTSPRTPSVYFLPLIWCTKFRTHARQKLHFYMCLSTFLDGRRLESALTDSKGQSVRDFRHLPLCQWDLHSIFLDYLKMKQTVCPEMSVRIYHSTPRKLPNKRRSQGLICY